MIPGPARILVCPECGETKEVMTLMSGNTFGADFWSDGKMDAPMLPQPSPIQKCPHCGAYIWAPSQEVKTAKDGHESFELGILSYDETKDAVKKLLKTHTDTKDELAIRFTFIQAYNDEYRRLDKDGQRYQGRTGEPSDEDFLFFNECLERAYEAFMAFGDRSSVAEMLRELGRFDECVALIEGMEDYNPNDEFDYNTQVHEHAKHGRTAVFYRKLKP